MVLMLLENGQDFNSTGREGTSLAVASLFGHISVVQLLVQKGRDPHMTVPRLCDVYPSYHLNTPIYFLCQGCDKGEPLSDA